MALICCGLGSQPYRTLSGLCVQCHLSMLSLAVYECVSTAILCWEGYFDM